MQNPRLAARYAKSLLDLAVEQNALDATLEDVRALNDTVKGSREFAAVLRSPIIKADKKQAILDAVVGNRMKPLTNAFVKLLVQKGREAALPEIAQAFIDSYKVRQGIKSVRLTTAAPVSDAVAEAVKQKVATAMPGQQIELTTKVDERLIGGFLIEMDNTLVDASVRRDLMDIKKQFVGNLYVQNIR